MPLLTSDQLKTPRQKLMREMAAAGHTYAEIGKAFKISRARVHQLLTGYDSPSHRTSPENQG